MKLWNTSIKVTINSSLEYKLICCANQVTGFYTWATLAFNELSKLICKKLK